MSNTKGREAISRKQSVAPAMGSVVLLAVVVGVSGFTTSGTGQEPCLRVATTTTFSDVNPGADTTAVDEVVANGMMQGCGSTYFCPGELVPREDMAVAGPHSSPKFCCAAGSCGAFGRAQASEPAT